MCVCVCGGPALWAAAGRQEGTGARAGRVGVGISLLGIIGTPHSFWKAACAGLCIAQQTHFVVGVGVSTDRFEFHLF